ncbi:hypothetical protein CC2G_004364 [Coprinopsis cinerea AmutBmut pab1-1]|nr:hypothetical protein CC2G_004364 [Coprinopsis cinerea AmutBmut pab1-1]
MIFSLSDTQLITTVAIMISTWVELSKGLSVYHFTVISNLVWLACNTQILAFLSLRHSVKPLASLPNQHRDGDRGQSPDTSHKARHNHCCDYPDLRPYLFPPSLYLRALLMFCQFGMMVTVVTLQSHKDYRAFNCPVICVAKEFKPDSNQLATTITSYFLLFWARHHPHTAHPRRRTGRVWNTW